MFWSRLSDGIFFTECTVNRRLWGTYLVLRLVGAFMDSVFVKNFRCATRRGVENFTLWTALSEATLPRLWLAGIRKGVGRTHKDPPLMFRVLYLARPRTGTRSFMVDAGEMKSHRPRIWCLSARFSRLFPPALSGSNVRLKEAGGKRGKLMFPEGFRGTWRCPRSAA